MNRIRTSSRLLACSLLVSACSLEGPQGTYDSRIRFEVSVPGGTDPRAVVALTFSEARCADADLFSYNVRRLSLQDARDRERTVSTRLPTDFLCLRAIPLIPRPTMGPPDADDRLVDGLDTLFVDVTLGLAYGTDHVVELAFD